MFGILKKGIIFMLYDDKKFIGQIIRNARKNAKMTQAELSEKINMSDKNLVNIETGKQFPQLNNFFRIIDLLNIPIEAFGVKRNLNELDKNKRDLFKQILLATPEETDSYIKLLHIAKKL